MSLPKSWILAGKAASEINRKYPSNSTVEVASFGFEESTFRYFINLENGGYAVTATSVIFRGAESVDFTKEGKCQIDGDINIYEKDECSPEIPVYALYHIEDWPWNVEHDEEKVQEMMDYLIKNDIFQRGVEIYETLRAS